MSPKYIALNRYVVPMLTARSITRSALLLGSTVTVAGNGAVALVHCGSGCSIL